MMKKRIKTPCGATSIVSVTDRTELAALLKKLVADHADEADGPGCVACKPEKWTVQRTAAPSDGTPGLLSGNTA
jgi:hypothetical protein